jgi:DNA-binding transcriptional ArsR family regulator
MLRIHFTSEDLARTRMAAAPDPLWELLLSQFRLHDRDRPPVFRPWFNRLREDPAHAQKLRPGSQLLSALAPRGPYIPDFLNPEEAAQGLEAGLEAILRTPRRQLRAQLQKLDQHSPVPNWLRPLADGDLTLLRGVADTLRRYYQAAITPGHDLVHTAVEADRARKARFFLAGGMEAVLTGLSPVLRWRPPVLEVNYAVDRDLHLDGRGLLLVPSFFSRGTADSLADPELPPVLVYSIDQECRWDNLIADDRGQSLAALVGVTRAAVLDAIDSGATTTELATRVYTSAATVSRHTTILREAGLIATCRDGKAVLHTLTPLGSALLGSRGRPVSSAVG